MRADTGFDERDAVLEYLHGQLIGPLEGDEEALPEKPHQRYLTGILYPEARGEQRNDQDADNDEILDENAGQLADDDDDDPLTLAGQRKPSSVGISFVAETRCAVEVEIEAARYVPGDEGVWHRRSCDLVADRALTVPPPTDGGSSVEELVSDGGFRIRVTWRPRGSETIVTAVLVNDRKQHGTEPVDSADCLFQVVLRCRPLEGRILRYPARRHLYTDDEAEELELLYRNIPVFALGHGAAAVWDDASAGPPAHVETSFLPVHVVPGVSFDVPGLPDDVRDLHWLSRMETEAPDIVPVLDQFVDGYRDWCTELQEQVAEVVPAELKAAADRVLGRVVDAEQRMRRGIALLREDELARRAFGLANQAMLMQMVHSSERLAGKARAVVDAPPVDNVEYPPGVYFWRPFQLGFLLLTLEGAACETEDRDLVDLIWFPTGGGKTEAYLGLAAFVIFLRRLRSGDDGAGTTVITRYTLRLLTSQQFQRASTLIAACEVLRRRAPDVLGSRPVSIGIWVGGNNSPNTYAEAVRLLAKLQEKEPVNIGFQVESCPWCGARVVPAPEDEQRWGVHAENNAFRIKCLNRTCTFSEGIPISSVDQDLYEHPPTMLVGTVDKFARAVWDRRAGVFFGAGEDPGPSLVIQDEFHLISGPLGTIVGLYEAAFDVLMARNGARPKVVASTATIRRADQQSRGVFGREVRLFPPAGLDGDDSYFVRLDPRGPGRAYAGLMPQGHTPLTALVHLCAALLQAPVDLGLRGYAQDAYWTLVAYHNSLRELGKTITLAQDDIPARLKVIAEAEDDCRKLNHDNTVELTSNVPAGDIPKLLQRLAVPAGGSSEVSFLASTNMISVGVDVSRLGLMTVVGQPKTTAEYIQATSRVGRSSKRPGLVVTLYSPSKPRDRSHYESFVPYHSTLYRSVEPTSVTPFSLPARQRALHACLVLLARHARGWSGDEDAAHFDKDDAQLAGILRSFVERAGRAEPEELDRVQEHLRLLVDYWSDRVDAAAEEGERLRYSGPGREKPVLLRRFHETGEGWHTLDSMRSVDVEVGVHVRGK